MEADPEAVVALASGVEAIAVAVEGMVREKIATVEALARTRPPLLPAKYRSTAFSPPFLLCQGKHLVSVANSAMKVPLPPARLEGLHNTLLPGVLRCLREKKLQPGETAQIAYALASSGHGSEEFYNAVAQAACTRPVLPGRGCPGA